MVIPNQSVWEKLQKNELSPSILNDTDVISIFEKNYDIKSLYSISRIDGTRETGIPSYLIQRKFRRPKITTMPFNFYPPIIGTQIKHQAAMNHLILIAKKVKNCYVEYKTFQKIDYKELNAEKIHEVQTSFVSLLEIQKSYDVQAKLYQKRFQTALRNKKKQSNALGFRFYKIRTEKELKQFFLLMVKLYRNKHHMITQPYGLLKDLFLQGQPSGKVDVYVAELNGKIEAGIFVMKSLRKWDYCWGATSEKYYKMSLSSILIDMMIQEGIDQNVHSISLGASAVSDKDLIFFKEKWGCETIPVYSYYWNYEPRVIDLNNSYKFIRYLFSKIPLFILERAPRLIVPHLT